MASAATVLLIDDDSAVRRGFGRVLESAGFRTLFAEDGVRGLAAIREAAPDAVLLDLNMPGIGGLETLTKAACDSPDTPVIVVSGSGRVDDVVQALRRGAWDFVTKPVEDPHLLVQAVRRALEKAMLVRENREQRASLERLNGRLTDAFAELRTDQEAGRRIQFQLLPADGLCIGDYEFTRRLFPSQYLSGDFVDYFALGEHHAGMYVADVSGHGAASAFVTAMVAALISRYREALNRRESDVMLWPDKLLESLNRDLGLRKLHKHLTMFYAVLDLRSHRLSFCSAGHYPFPLFDDGTNVHVLECSGRPLGLFADARYSRREASLESTKRMLLVSDGVLELMPEPPGQQKLDRLVATLKSESGIDGLVRGFGIDPSAHPRDDVTLLLVERKAPHA
jgi:sigma-B regulation protein RsbU (phosphoserine phosphatase)